MKGQKESILFVVDKRNWAFHHIVLAIFELISHKYDCYICFVSDYNLNKLTNVTNSIRIKHNTKEILKIIGSLFIGKQYKAMLIDKSLRFSFPFYLKNPIFSLNNNNSRPKIFNFKIEMDYYFQYISKIPLPSYRKIIGIYTESFPHEGYNFDIINNENVAELNTKQFIDKYIKNYNGLIVGSQLLFNKYSTLFKNTAMFNAVYKQNEFIGENNNNLTNPLIIGWTGNPNREFKGFYSIIIPAIEKVKQTNRNITLKTKFSGPYDELLTFYNNVNVIIIASDADTGPFMFSEASLCNVPSISTNIGFPSMVIKNNINGILIDRTIDDLSAAIIRVYDNRHLLASFSGRIRNDYLKVLDNSIFASNLIELLEKIK